MHDGQEWRYATTHGRFQQPFEGSGYATGTHKSTRRHRSAGTHTHSTYHIFDDESYAPGQSSFYLRFYALARFTRRITFIVGL